jgi:hypothetical protein
MEKKLSRRYITTSKIIHFDYTQFCGELKICTFFIFLVRVCLVFLSNPMQMRPPGRNDVL